jgi:hypothetical protein
MATCATCEKTILFGGKRLGDQQYCSEKCLITAGFLGVADSIPRSVVDAKTWELYNGRCPKCSGPGPVTLHPSYRVFSVLVLTSSSTRQNICCRRCATRERLKDAAFSFACGWWGFPWGLIYTPVQIGRNLAAIARTEELSRPPEELARLVRLQLAAAATQEPRAPSPERLPR